MTAESRRNVRLSAVVLTCLALVSSPSIWAGCRLHAQTGPSTDRTFTTLGTVQRLLPDARLVLIAHAEIAGLMEAMDSMAFSIDEHPVLRNVKPGDRVRFTLRQSGSTLTLLRIDLAR